MVVNKLIEIYANGIYSRDKKCFVCQSIVGSTSEVEVSVDV